VVPKWWNDHTKGALIKLVNAFHRVISITRVSLDRFCWWARDERKEFLPVYIRARTFVAENPVGEKLLQPSLFLLRWLSLIIGWRSIFRADFPIGIIKGARVVDFCCTSPILGVYFQSWDWSFDISQESSCYATISSESRWWRLFAIMAQFSPFSRRSSCSISQGCSFIMRYYLLADALNQNPVSPIEKNVLPCL
jgi:hypothetical protein